MRNQILQCGAKALETESGAALTQKQQTKPMGSTRDWAAQAFRLIFCTCFLGCTELVLSQLRTMPEASQDYKWSRVKMRILKCFASLPSCLWHTHRAICCTVLIPPLQADSETNVKILVHFEEKFILDFLDTFAYTFVVIVLLTAVLVTLQELFNCAN